MSSQTKMKVKIRFIDPSNRSAEFTIIAKEDSCPEGELDHFIGSFGDLIKDDLPIHVSREHDEILITPHGYKGKIISFEVLQSED